MLCENCKKQVNNVTFKNLMLEKIFNCEHCRYVKDTIENSCNSANIIYKNVIFRHLNLIMPIKLNDAVFCLESVTDENKIISNTIKQLGHNNCYFRTKEEKFNIINSVLGLLYDEFHNKIRYNPTKYLIEFLNCLEYNRYVASKMVLWLKGKINHSISIEDDLLNIIIESLDSIKVSENKKNYFDIKSVYFSIENLMAKDKASLEHGIELTYRLICTNKSIFEKKEFDLSFIEVLSYIRAIDVIRYIKVETTEGVGSSLPLYIDENSNIVLTERFSNFHSHYISDMVNDREIYDANKYIDNINNIIKEELGFSLDTVNKIVHDLSVNCKAGDEFLVGHKGYWCEVIQDICKCEKDEANSIIEYFTYNTEGIDLFSESSRKDKRILRKCLISIEDYYLCSVNTLTLSLIGFQIDILDGEISNKKLVNSLNKIYKQIDDEFEDKVYKEIKLNFKNLLIKKNVEQKDIKSKNYEEFQLPGEIDILLLYNNKIFVIECKNYNLRIDYKSIANEFGRLTKINNKSVQGKLARKVNCIKENYKAVIEFMGGDCSLNYDSTPIGVITTSTFSIVSNEENTQFPIVTWTNLCDWIRNN
ncbi:NERD domain-containing protein [Clostridioides difficile]|uniref:NERD domain-containing protein n=1 Tax=Clostridioides difficile TaxID=1496 RepID=UPI00038D9395|nr:NERD domain-containing protein [Clostridioides difficile]EGT4639292.1 NERD domain-containing protein [Clostridioides difficile]EQJ83678.1 nuclease-related domain protein [Clostridioides difficile P48]MBH8106213.1 NERD domain-containing protein [Clostridioides difficile]MBJ9796955.1 NERD domain-containing protein [Clostridioides difficile]MCA0607063.1 NERD domain-containing protein [Clostridioides difficile]